MLTTALLAGCASTETSDDIVVDEVPSLGLGGCSEHYAVLPIPMDYATSMMPEGFSPVPFDASGLFAAEYLMAYSCKSLSGAAAGEDVREFTAGLYVTPPEAYQTEDIPHYAIPYGFFSTNDDAVALYESWGLMAAKGTISISGVGTPAATVGVVEAGDDTMTVRLQTAVTGEASVFEAGVFRMFALDENKTVTNAVDGTWSNSTAVSGPDGFGQALGEVDYDGLPAPAGPGWAAAAPGYGFHFGGDEYGYTYTFVELPVLEDAHHDDEPAAIRGL